MLNVGAFQWLWKPQIPLCLLYHSRLILSSLLTRNSRELKFPSTNTLINFHAVELSDVSTRDSSSHAMSASNALSVRSISVFSRLCISSSRLVRCLLRRYTFRKSPKAIENIPIPCIHVNFLFGKIINDKSIVNPFRSDVTVTVKRDPNSFITK